MPLNCNNGASSSVNIWQMSHRAVGPVREHLLDDRVVAVLLLGLDQGERGVGEYGVVAPDGEQFAPGLRQLCG